MYLCYLFFKQGINGCTGQVLHRDKEKNAEKHVQGPLKSEKEALLLGNVIYHCAVLYICREWNTRNVDITAHIDADT